jgi:hypothetical protein
LLPLDRIAQRYTHNQWFTPLSEPECIPKILKDKQQTATAKAKKRDISRTAGTNGLALIEVEGE